MFPLQSLFLHYGFQNSEVSTLWYSQKKNSSVPFRTKFEYSFTWRARLIATSSTIGHHRSNEAQWSCCNTSWPWVLSLCGLSRPAHSILPLGQQLQTKRRP